jgi:hypothetical protein
LEILEFTRAKRVRISGQHRHHHFTTFLLDGIDFGLAATSSNVEQRKRQQLFSFVPRLGRFCGGDFVWLGLPQQQIQFSLFLVHGWKSKG